MNKDHEPHWGYVTVGEGRGREITLHYRIHGKGRFKIIFVMGFATSCNAWSPQVEFFEKNEDYQFCVFDNRGVGRSSKPPGRYRTSDMARDALELADFLGWKKFHLVGLSMGGMISLELSCLAPERLLSLSLLVTHAGGPNSVVPAKGFVTLMKLLRTRDTKIRTRLTMPMIHSDKWLNEKHSSGKTNLEYVSEIHEERMKEDGPLSFLGIFGQISAIMTHYISKSRMKKIKDYGIPVFICTGTKDHLVRPKNSFLLKNFFEDATFLVLEGAGHAINMECKDELNHSLLEIFKKGEIFHKERPAPILEMKCDEENEISSIRHPSHHHKHHHHRHYQDHDKEALNYFC